MIKEDRHFGLVWLIPGENRGKYPFCHSIYIEGVRVLIDPASDRERLVQLRESPGVETVWLSHWHEDHFMHLDLFDGIPLCISEADAPSLSDLEHLYGKPREPRVFYELGERGHMKKHLERLVGQGMVALKGNRYTRV